MVVAGEPVEEDHTAWGIPAAAEALSELRSAGLPITTCWIPLESAIRGLVVAVPRDWSARLGGVDQKTLIDRVSKVAFASKATIPIPKILVVNELSGLTMASRKSELAACVFSGSFQLDDPDNRR